MDTNLSKLQGTVEDTGAWCAAYSPWGHKELEMTKQLQTTKSTLLR